MESGFFDSYRGDRKYRAQHFAALLQGIMSNGVMEAPADQYKVLPGSLLRVRVNPGFVMIGGCFGYEEAVTELPLAQAHSTLHRIDRIVARLDMTARSITLAVKQGETAESPAAPALSRDGTVHELCLASISVSAGTVAITEAMITDTRADAELCGGVIVKTAYGLALEGKADKPAVEDLRQRVTFMEPLVNDPPYVFSPFTASKVFTASGTWVCPAGVKKVSVWLVDGGEGSRGARYSKSYSGNGAGGGIYGLMPDGARGRMGLVRNFNAVPGVSYTVMVGSGGSAGVAPNSGNGSSAGGAGGKSSFNGIDNSVALLAETGISQSSSVPILNFWENGTPPGWDDPDLARLVSGNKITANGVDCYCPLEPTDSKETSGLGGGGWKDAVSVPSGAGSGTLMVNGKPGNAGRVVIYY